MLPVGYLYMKIRGLFMTRFESISKQTQNYSKAELIKEEVQYYCGKLLDTVFYKPLHWFKVRFVPAHRYHILDLTKGGNGYGYGWRDTDTRMLQACFLLLVEYVEREKPFDVVDWESDEKTKEIGKEIKELYHWWKVGRAEKRSALNKEWAANEDQSEFIPVDSGGYRIYIPESVKKLNEKENRLDEEDQRNLERLVKIRGWLWT